MKYALAIILLLALAQTASAEGVLVNEHAIRLHVLSERDLYIFETVTYAAEGNASFNGTGKAWIPNGAINLTIESDENPIIFDLQGNNASFKLAIPALNLTNMYISYSLSVQPQGFDKQFAFETITQYPVEFFSIVIISQPNFDLTYSNNLEPVMLSKFAEQYKAYISSLVNRETLQAQQKISVRFTENKTQITPTRTAEPPTRLQDISPYTVMAALLIVALAIVLVFFWRGKKKIPDDSSKAEIEALSATLKEIEEDFKAGKLSDEEYRKLKAEYEERKARAEKQKRR